MEELAAPGSAPRSNSACTEATLTSPCQNSPEHNAPQLPWVGSVGRSADDGVGSPMGAPGGAVGLGAMVGCGATACKVGVGVGIKTVAVASGVDSGVGSACGSQAARIDKLIAIIASADARKMGSVKAYAPFTIEVATDCQASTWPADNTVSPDPARVGMASKSVSHRDPQLRCCHPVSHRYGIGSQQAASSLRHERTTVMKPYSHTLNSARGW